MAIFKLFSILKNNQSASGYFNYIFEDNSLKGLFGQNMKKLKILKLSRDFRYLQKLALNIIISRLILMTMVLLLAEFLALRLGYPSVILRLPEVNRKEKNENSQQILENSGYGRR